MSRPRILVALVSVSLVSLLTIGVLAQSTPGGAPGPGWVQMANGGWLPCSHPATAGHPGCASTPTAPTPPTTPTAPPTGYGPGGLTGCDFPDPSRPNGRSIACVIGQYRVGRVYWFTDVERAIVLSVAADALGVEVVTVQFLDALGAHRGDHNHVLAFRNDGSLRPWVWLANHGQPVELLPIVQ